MLRCLQGMLFVGLAIFALKGSFQGSRNYPHISPQGDVYYTAKSFFETSDGPWGCVRDKLLEAALLTFIGVYVLLTGELARLRKYGHRASPLTFLSLTAAFLGLFSAKFTYHHTDPVGPYPPFDTLKLTMTYLVFAIVALYYFVFGEIAFYTSSSSATANAAESMMKR